MHRIIPVSLLLCIILITTSTSAQRGKQPYAIQGSVSDTLNNARLHNAAITLLRSRDSVLISFTRADSAGAFALHPDTLGRYILLVTYPGFADYIESVHVKDATPVSMGTIAMVSRTHLLQEFVLKKKSAAILIKGDTTEYNADSFTVRNGATVDELLKKLPGLQVDKDGKIMAQGEQVQKVLVDGEEFFSDDPAVVTKSLQAATVDKVQVFDKKSDQATFTGIDDGEKTKTINLMLKEDMKKGAFGKVVAGAGTDGYFDNQVMVNAFKGKRQISAFGIVSNTGTIGLNWQDRDKYGSGNNREYDEESGMMYTYNTADDDELSGSWRGTYNGQGIPTVWTGGLHYADKWAKDQQHITGNYRYSKNNIETEGSTTSQYFLPNDSGYVRNQTRSTFSTAERHGADGLYEWTIDTSSNLKLTASGNYIDRASNGMYNTRTNGSSGALINTSNRTSTSTSSSESFNAGLSYRKKFQKKGRSMSAELRETYRSSDGTGYLFSDNEYYSDGLLDTADNINQQKHNTGSTFSLNGRVSYTEPLSKVTFLTLRYGVNLSNSTSERLSFNKDGADWSKTADSLYSSSYGYDVLTHNGSATLRVVLKKYNFSIGGDVFSTSWDQHDRILNTDQHRNFNNFAPSASVKYNFSKQAYVSVNYSGSTRQPSLEQLQPLRQNTDPLNISIGNPDLHQEFNNSLNLSYHSYKPLSGVYAYAGGGGNYTNDDIASSEFFDSLGRHTYQYINVQGDYNGYFYGGYGFKIKKLDLSARVNSNVNFSNANTYVNGQRNTSRNNSYSIGFNLDKDWKKGDKSIAGFNTGPDFSYNDNHSSISTYTTSYWSVDIDAEGYVELPWKLTVRSSVVYNLREKTAIFNANNNVVRWNASLTRKFLKSEKLELKIAVTDILNQNLGYSRSASDNNITEDRYNTIRRYGLLSLNWNFAKNPGTPAKP